MSIIKDAIGEHVEENWQHRLDQAIQRLKWKGQGSTIEFEALVIQTRPPSLKDFSIAVVNRAIKGEIGVRIDVTGAVEVGDVFNLLEPIPVEVLEDESANIVVYTI